MYDNHALLNTNAQNNPAATPGWSNAQINITATLSCVELNWADIKRKLKESLKFKYQDVICEN